LNKKFRFAEFISFCFVINQHSVCFDKPFPSYNKGYNPERKDVVLLQTTPLLFDILNKFLKIETL
jgi:hypothetical protein